MTLNCKVNIFQSYTDFQQQSSVNKYWGERCEYINTQVSTLLNNENQKYFISVLWTYTHIWILTGWEQHVSSKLAFFPTSVTQATVLESRSTVQLQQLLWCISMISEAAYRAFTISTIITLGIAVSVWIWSYLSVNQLAGLHKPQAWRHCTAYVVDALNSGLGSGHY